MSFEGRCSSIRRGKAWWLFKMGEVGRRSIMFFFAYSFFGRLCKVKDSKFWFWKSLLRNLGMVDFLVCGGSWMQVGSCLIIFYWCLLSFYRSTSVFIRVCICWLMPIAFDFLSRIDGKSAFLTSFFSLIPDKFLSLGSKLFSVNIGF